jgi:hypothetical protein
LGFGCGRFVFRPAGVGGSGCGRLLDVRGRTAERLGVGGRAESMQGNNPGEEVQMTPLQHAPPNSINEKRKIRSLPFRIRPV